MVFSTSVKYLLQCQYCEWIARIFGVLFHFQYPKTNLFVCQFCCSRWWHSIHKRKRKPKEEKKYDAYTYIAYPCIYQKVSRSISRNIYAKKDTYGQIQIVVGTDKYKLHNAAFFLHFFGLCAVKLFIWNSWNGSRNPNFLRRHQESSQNEMKHLIKTCV